MKSRVLAVIPARGGSKGVPRKNIRDLAGRPLIAYTIETALSCSVVDKVIVSTDDNEIADISRKLGADVPFLRPAELALDSSPDQPVFTHALSWLEANQNYVPDFVLNLRCTTPFKTVQDIEGLVNRWKELKCDSVRSVTRADGVFHPYWMLKVKAGFAESFVENTDAAQYLRRQLLPPAFRLNGVVDGASPAVMRRSSNLWGDRIGLYEIPEERSLDIDTEFDFKLAELLMKDLRFQ